jgi:hypothetical protein
MALTVADLDTLEQIFGGRDEPFRSPRRDSWCRRPCVAGSGVMEEGPGYID